MPTFRVWWYKEAYANHLCCVIACLFNAGTCFLGGRPKPHRRLGEREDRDTPALSRLGADQLGLWKRDQGRGVSEKGPGCGRHSLENLRIGSQPRKPGRTPEGKRQ